MKLSILLFSLAGMCRVCCGSPLTQTIASTVSQSGFVGLPAVNVNPFPLTAVAYDFDGQQFRSLKSIDWLEVTLTMYDGDTEPGNNEYGDFTLLLDGISTGVQLNGFENRRTTTLTFSKLLPANAPAILAALQ